MVDLSMGKEIETEEDEGKELENEEDDGKKYCRLEVPPRFGRGEASDYEELVVVPRSSDQFFSDDEWPGWERLFLEKIIFGEDGYYMEKKMGIRLAAEDGFYMEKKMEKKRSTVFICKQKASQPISSTPSLYPYYVKVPDWILARDHQSNVISAATLEQIWTTRSNLKTFCQIFLDNKSKAEIQVSTYNGQKHEKWGIVDLAMGKEIETEGMRGRSMRMKR
ncbi:hypothetical protein L1987_75781 [Smallanthus sonchifolius]|uniref:Uncharacterized protein n=1 Tax=Smallanthus sonchifolius TaxID=185202 RepID=A0ACB9A5X6_9ASTR|nr:hypothetical protein L1987_75781 [Smallanthus sonchifolius]